MITEGISVKACYDVLLIYDCHCYVIEWREWNVRFAAVLQRLQTNDEQELCRVD